MTSKRHADENCSLPMMDADLDRFQVVELADSVFLVDETTGVSHQIGSHGRRLFWLFCAGSSVEEAARVLASETGSDGDIVLKDTRRLVAELVDLGVIVNIQT